MNAINANLARNEDTLSRSTRNVVATTCRVADEMKEVRLGALQSTISELKNTVANLNTRLNNNNSTLGLLTNDRQLYDKLNTISSRVNQMALSAEILFDDLRLHPKRYVNISVFGNKNAGEPITSPSRKDTIAH